MAPQVGRNTAAQAAHPVGSLQSQPDAQRPAQDRKRHAGQRAFYILHQVAGRHKADRHREDGANGGCQQRQEDGLDDLIPGLKGRLRQVRPANVAAQRGADVLLALAGALWQLEFNTEMAAVVCARPHREQGQGIGGVRGGHKTDRPLGAGLQIEPLYHNGLAGVAARGSEHKIRAALIWLGRRVAAGRAGHQDGGVSDEYFLLIFQDVRPGELAQGAQAAFLAAFFAELGQIHLGDLETVGINN